MEAVREVCAIPIGALAILSCMMAAVEFRLPLTGASHSTLRAAWVGVMTVFMLVGGIGLGLAVTGLGDGDPTLQFTPFQRRRVQ